LFKIICVLASRPRIVLHIPLTSAIYNYSIKMNNRYKDKVLDNEIHKNTTEFIQAFFSFFMSIK